MTYQETLDYLFNATPVFEHVGTSAYKEGLANTFILDEHFEHPHRRFKTIHIAGTNGKGSCSHTIASILQEAGYKVGLYTSPHLVDFRERIRVNGKCIEEKYVVDFVESEHSFFEPLHPSFFELTTALAFKYFAESRVDIAVIEVGLGGRLDCTNIITPVLSVITNISFDHTNFLGDTLAKIALEKAGIIKRNVPVVIGEYTEETRPVFEDKAKEMDSPLFFAEEFEAPHIDVDFELKGNYQEKNKQTILCVACLLGLEKEYVKRGMENVCQNTGLMGRWQILQENPKVVCDTGHNVAGWEYLSRQIKTQPCRQLRIVFGMVDDKDIHSVMELLPRNAIYYWTQAHSKRAIPAEEVKLIAQKHHLNGQAFHDVGAAYEVAKKDAEKEDFIFVGGSSYIVADLLELLFSI